MGPLAEPFSTGASWLARAVAVSVVLHVVIAVAWWLVAKPSESEVELVNIELAPPPPPVEALPAEVAKPPEAVAAAAAAAAAASEPQPPNEDGLATVDAGVDAPVDAPPKKKKRGDAAIDAEVPLVAESETETEHADAGVGDGDAATEVAAVDPAVGSSAEPGVPAATEAGSGSGEAGMDNQPAVDGAPTTAGTAANLLAYFPAGHQITVLIRFDRLRKTEWALPATKLFKPMPDYGGLFGTRDVALADQLDMLVISSPRPRDATATTLVGHTQLSRTQMREFLTNPDAPIEWSASKGGMAGKRTGKQFPNDRRVLLSPWRGWFVLAQPEDVPGLTAPSTGNIDTIEAKAKLPPWLATIRTIEQETSEPPADTSATAKPGSAARPGSTAKPGSAAKPGAAAEPVDDKRGPALVLTLTFPGQRFKIPDVGLGVTSAPSPERLSLAMELVKQGWLVRGNIVFASEADATEFVQTVQDVQTRITDSRILSVLLKKQHAFNAVAGLSLARTGARVSYATSVSIADARALLAATSQTLDAYFAKPP